ncbi:MAG: pro-sigmaK processing inhibitor BofA family protein [Bacillota bacterium]
MDIAVLAAYIFGLLVIFLIGKALIMPMRMILTLTYNGIIGGILLWILNLAGQYVGINVAINPASALTVGFLGIPGLVLLVILQQFVF